MFSNEWSRYSLAIAIGLAAFAPRNPATAQDSLISQAEQLAKPYIDSGTVVGLSIGLFQGDSSGDQETTVHLGHVSANGERPNDDTVYEIGSVSKVFTGLLLADAVTQKMLRLNQNAQDLLPKGVAMPQWKHNSIQLVDISTHFSGLPRLSDNMPFSNPANPYEDYPAKLAYEFLTDYELTRAPGEKHEYSNFGVALLGHLISENANASYDELLKHRIAEPLGMKSTAVELTASMKGRFATPHIQADEPTVGWDFADIPGAGGIRSTTRDMLQFAKANIIPPEGPLGSAIDLAWQQHRAADGVRMGLGWHFAGDGNTRWHNGQTGGFHSMLMVNRKKRLAVVLLANTATAEVDRLASDLMQMLAGVETTPREFAQPIDVDEKLMQRYVGRYALAPTFVFSVSIDKGKLMVGVTGQPTHEVYAKSDTNWFYKVVQAEITFKLDANGECNSLELFQGGVRQTAKRVK